MNMWISGRKVGYDSGKYRIGKCMLTTVFGGVRDRVSSSSLRATVLESVTLDSSIGQCLMILDGWTMKLS